MPRSHGTGRAPLAAILAAVRVTALVGCSNSSSGGGKSARSTTAHPRSAPRSGGGRDQVTIDRSALPPDAPSALFVAPGARITGTSRDPRGRHRVR
ncbi:hypothetical protein [Streptomyces sp. NPDC050804]|uniref:hypothetical protein n=1 Tax=unclassified Streptomyces TaxID=2593676 RepID=UPI0034411796|nr:hypothetical protein OG214_36290 [Streptomyces sp. NBC_00872]